MIQSVEESWHSLTREAREGGAVSEPNPSAEAAVKATAPLTDVAGVVLAGVHQWGGCPLDRSAPRPLLPIANQPLITYSLDWLHVSGLGNACVCANSQTKVLREHLGGASWRALQLDYYEDVMPRGPAGCVRDAWLESDFDSFVVVDGTVVPRIDLGAMLTAHEKSGAVLTVAVTTGGPLGQGDKPSLTPTGIYLFTRRALDYVDAAGYQDIKESLIPLLYARGEKVATYVVEATNPRVTGIDSYLAVNGWALELLLGHAQPPEGYTRIGDAWVHSSTTVHPRASLSGPTLIGPEGAVGEGVTLVGPVTIGARCTVGEGAIICRSSIWDNCEIGAQSILDRCILPYGSRVEPGAQLRNLAFVDAQPHSALSDRLRVSWTNRRQRRRQRV